MPALVSYNLTMTIYACTEAIIAFANRAPNGVEDHRADASTQPLPFLAAGAFSFAGAQCTVSLRDAATRASIQSSITPTSASGEHPDVPTPLCIGGMNEERPLAAAVIR